MKKESNFKKSVLHFLYLFSCMFIVKGIILPVVKEHNRNRQAEKERLEVYQTLMANYAFYLSNLPESKVDSLSVYPSEESIFEE